MLAIRFAQARRHNPFHHSAQLRRNAADAEAEVGRERTVDSRNDFGLAADQVAAHVHGSRQLPDLALNLVGHALQRGEIVAAHEDIDRRFVRCTLHELRVRHLAIDERHAREQLADLFLDVGDTALADLFLRGLDAQVRRTNLPVHADRAEDLDDFRDRQDLFLHARGRRDAFFERRAGRQLDDDLELAAVFNRHELRAHHRRRAQADDEHRRCDAERLPRVPQSDAENPVIAAIERVVRAAHPFEQPAGTGASAFLRRNESNEARGEHRVECERHQQRHRDGERNRQGERLEELADDSGHEPDRQEHREDREGRGHHREPDLRRAAACRGHGVFAVLHVPEDVFAHDDRVVDEDADHERQCHQRHHVDREARDPHEEERRHNRRRQRSAVISVDRQSRMKMKMTSTAISAPKTIASRTCFTFSRMNSASSCTALMRRAGKFGARDRAWRERARRSRPCSLRTAS